ncbi:hypothetical protein NQ317_005775 [Molorchus minor]|uniref:tRNA pseudouridine synthase n=1 Tax=Molorchus minor TaxID=1323400 RepID=A0ABQ9JAR6_9CUCU|nr:hypothetical protein NQ317_005775 [Molorchus minor]
MTWKVKLIIVKVLPDNIQCIAWAPVKDSFSARFDCKGRIYKYYFPKGNLDIEKMTIASRKLLGSHDFRNLCKMDVGNGVVEFTRNISLVSIEPINLYRSEDEYAIYVLTLKGNAFLWHQIRCILGVLLLVGQNKEEPSVIDELLDVERNSRKPEYNMASEIPLNLFSSEYDLKKWHYDEDSLSQVITKLNNIWTHTAIKQSMIGDMLTDLNKVFKDIKTSDDTVTKCFSDCLIQGVKSKKYIPVMKRQLCHSLEEKIEHFKKRNRIENIDDIQK